jgi:hypothetical protein
MNSSALLGAAILPFMMDQVYRGRVPWSVISAFTCRSLQANLAVKLSHAKSYKTYPKAHLLANVGGPISPNQPHFGPPRQHSQCLFSGAAAFATKSTVEQDSHTATYCHDSNFAAPYPIWASPLVAIYLRVSPAAFLIALRL